MTPLLNSEEITNSLIVSHIAKLLFYSIKNQKETYTSKSLNVIENILRFVLHNPLNESIKECVLEFIREILKHSRPKEDKFEDEFQEKIKISKSNLFEHFTKVFLQWLRNLSSIQEHASKIQLICNVCSEMLVYRKGNESVLALD